METLDFFFAEKICLDLRREVLMSKIKILIIEDQRSVAEILAMDLEQAGHQISGIVESGSEAIQHLIKTKIDLVLIDIVLKGEMDGIDVGGQIKTEYEIPIIYLSSSRDRATLKRARATNPNGYILKPYDLKDLRATINNTLAAKNPLVENLQLIKRKAKLANLKIKRIVGENFEFPSVQDYEAERAKHYQFLPQLSSQDQEIVATLKNEGVYITSLAELKLDRSKRLVKQLSLLQPHLYTLPDRNNWRVRIPSSRKFSHAEILFWGLGERLLDIIENYIGLPLFFTGVDLRRDIADAPLTDARHWHLDIDDDRMIKVIIYLNNVGKSGGPFEYIPRFLTEQIVKALDYKSGFVEEEAIAKVISEQFWQTCAAKAGNVVITDPCSIFHRAKPAQRNRYSITFGYTSRQPKIMLGQKLPTQELQAIIPDLSPRQLACLRLDK